jgi:hypothetical protein
MHITQAAQKVRPGTAWNSSTDEKGNITLRQADDGSPRVSVPAMDELKPFIDSDLYATQRREAYPSIGDQLDALWKGGADAQAMSDQIKAVKAKYPKPTQ